MSRRPGQYPIRYEGSCRIKPGYDAGRQRRRRGLELDPAYVDTAVRRWQALTGRNALHAVSGRSFDDLAREVEAAGAR